jgi:hypothetical protein
MVRNIQPFLLHNACRKRHKKRAGIARPTPLHGRYGAVRVVDCLLHGLNELGPVAG